MQITINTKEDSPEEIRKVIKMLLALIGDSPESSEHTPPAEGAQLFDMFGDPSNPASEQQPEADNPQADFAEKPVEYKDGDYKIIPY